MFAFLNRRAHKRVSPDPKNPIVVQIMDGEILESARARDVSVGGLGVYVAHELEAFETAHEVDVIIRIGQGRSFSARGVIRHRKAATGDDPRSLGIEFVNLGPDAKLVLERYIEKRLAEGGEVK